MGVGGWVVVGASWWMQRVMFGCESMDAGCCAVAGIYIPTTCPLC